MNIVRKNYLEWRKVYGENTAMVMAIICWILAMLLVGAVYLGIAGLISLVYGAFAGAFGLPTVTIWAWWGLILLVRVICEFVNN